jgi:hypothetical protein
VHQPGNLLEVYGLDRFDFLFRSENGFGAHIVILP